MEKANETFAVRLECAYWLIQANGELQVARKIAARSPSGFARSNGPWITALGYTLATMQKAVEDGFVLIHKACGYGTVEGDKKMGRSCPKCKVIQLGDAEMEKKSMKGA